MPPLAPDGLTAAQASAKSDSPEQVNLLHTLRSQLAEGKLFKDTETLLQAGGSATAPLNDREMLLENIVDMLSGLPVSRVALAILATGEST